MLLISSCRQSNVIFKMKHYFRLIYLFLSSLWRPKITFLQSSMIELRVWLTDLDLLMHMNNGVYLSLMDLGRMDLSIRSGFYKVLQKKKIYPVLASEVIRFKKSLQLFQKFQIHTDLIDWDEKYFYLRQRFVSKNELYASAIVKARFLKRSGGGVDPKEILQLLQISNEDIKQKQMSLSQEEKETLMNYLKVENSLR